MLQNLLDQIYLQYEKQKLLEIEKVTKFNIFSILNIERKEVETHSLFLYELLNPNGTHNQKEHFLHLFLKEVLQLEDYGHIEKNSIRREDLTNTGRRIDFTIETEKYQIAIEMKIDADDQKDQLLDYYVEMQRRVKEISGDEQKVKLYYLTIDGKGASRKSIQYDQNEVIPYEKISFSTDILNWIESCINAVESKTIVRELLSQYKVALENITNQKRGLEMEVKKDILCTEENFVASYAIWQSFVEASTELESQFWQKLITKLESENIEISNHDDISKNGVADAINNKKEINIRFKIFSFNETSDLMFQIGAKSTWASGAIYATVYECTNNRWSNGPRDDIAQAINRLKTVNFSKMSWCYGTAIINDDIQLRSEKLWNASIYIDDLVEAIKVLKVELEQLKY